MYTLGGVANPETGWGRADESWHFQDELARLGGPAWFALGDRDLATHIERTRRLANGEPLSAITADFARRLGVSSTLVPMSNDPVATMLDTDLGTLEFQDYFVRRRCEPLLTSVRYAGVERATPTTAIYVALASRSLRSIVICPSNPYLSIDPILAIPRLVERLRRASVPIVAICPLIGGAAVKGPTAKILDELDCPRTPVAIAHHYRGLIDGLVIDHADREWAERCDCATFVTATLMKTLDDRLRLATETLQFADRLAAERLHRGDARGA